jgi:hypothetical protein
MSNVQSLLVLAIFALAAWTIVIGEARREETEVRKSGGRKG